MKKHVITVFKAFYFNDQQSKKSRIFTVCARAMLDKKKVIKKRVLNPYTFYIKPENKLPWSR